MKALRKTPVEKRAFILSRVFDAPREKLYEYWTNPELMKKWWGPKDVYINKSKMNLRVGGTYHYSMVTLEGGEMWGKFEFEEIDAPHKLVFFNYFSDENGGITRHPMMASWPLKMLSTILFEDMKGKTKVVINWAPVDATEEEQRTFNENFDSMNNGWGGSLDRLTEVLHQAPPRIN